MITKCPEYTPPSVNHCPTVLCPALHNLQGTATTRLANLETSYLLVTMLKSITSQYSPLTHLITNSLVITNPCVFIKPPKSLTPIVMPHVIYNPSANVNPLCNHQSQPPPCPITSSSPSHHIVITNLPVNSLYNPLMSYNESVICCCLLETITHVSTYSVKVFAGFCFGHCMIFSM